VRIARHVKGQGVPCDARNTGSQCLWMMWRATCTGPLEEEEEENSAGVLSKATIKRFTAPPKPLMRHGAAAEGMNDEFAICFEPGDYVHD
jgi:hypothetical protein